MPPPRNTAAACCRMPMLSEPIHERFQAKYTVNTCAPAGTAATGGGDGGGGGGGVVAGTQAEMTRSEKRTRARFIDFPCKLIRKRYKSRLCTSTGNFLPTGEPSRWVHSL